MSSDTMSRSIQIGCDSDCVLNFLSDVDSLPVWTSFYQQRLGRQGERTRFATKLGESLTHIETEYFVQGGRATIVSEFAERTERAVLLVDPIDPADLACRVTFQVTFPAHVPPERRRLMLGQIEFELVRLRRRLESEVARSSILQAVP